MYSWTRARFGLQFEIMCIKLMENKNNVTKDPRYKTK